MYDTNQNDRIGVWQKRKRKKLRKILSNERKDVHTTCGVAESCFRYVMSLKIYNKDVQF